MTTDITTVVGQLNIVDGTWRSDAPNQVAVREPKSADKPGAGKGDLFVLVEVRGQASDRKTVERQLAETIRDAYYLAAGSTTASLRRAMQAAGDLLYDHNLVVDVEERIIGGAVALVIEEEDAFVAQIGPAACFVVLGDHIRRYPARSAWLDEAATPGQPVGETALGLRGVVEPRLYHLRLNPEDMLVLADSGLAGQVPLDRVVKAVENGNVKEAIKNLGKATQAKNCSALMLGVVEQTSSLPGPLKVVTSPHLSRFFRRSGKPPTPDESPAPAPITELDPVLAVDPVDPPSVPPEKISTRPDPLAKKGRAEEKINPPAEREAKSTPSAPKSRQQARKKTTPVAEEDYRTGPPPGSRVKELTSAVHEQTFITSHQPSPQDKPGPGSVGRIWRGLGMGLLMIVAGLGNGLKAVLGLFASKNEPQSFRQAGMQAQRPQSTSFISWAMLRNIAIAIPLLVGIIVGVSYLQKGRIQEAKYQELVTAAQNKFGQAQAVDRNSALALIAEANTLLTQAEQIKPDQPPITELRAQMAEETDKLANVQRLYYLPQLRQYTDPGTSMEKVIVQGVEIYVMDAGTDRVYHHRLDDLGEGLLPDDDTLLLAAQGQVVDEVAVGELLGMTWVSTGGNRQTSDLVILSSNGLFEYHPNWGLATTSFSAGESLVRPVAVSGFFGNFYLLDPQANLLLRYLPTADGYSSPPENYFPAEQPVDLSGAVDFAIDGAIYVLFKDGRIGKYLSGEPVEFNVSGLDVPFNNPVSIFTAPNEEVQYLYVADAGNQRVVQLNKDGGFVRQFKPRPGEAVSFANLQDIYVDEIGTRLYILDSNNLYVANIPTE